MSCSPFDLRDYILNELADSDRRLVETHLAACEGCREELDRLRVTEAALLTLADEEIPQRIGFVSDQVFEPSPLRRWWHALWGSAPRLGFASAAMLSIAILVSALTRPAPAPPAPAPATVDTAKLEAQFEQKLHAAVAKAVAEAEARQEERAHRQLAAYQERHGLEMKSLELAFDENLAKLEKRYSRLRLDLASAEFGAPR